MIDITDSWQIRDDPFNALPRKGETVVLSGGRRGVVCCNSQVTSLPYPMWDTDKSRHQIIMGDVEGQAHIGTRLAEAADVTNSALPYRQILIGFEPIYHVRWLTHTKHDTWEEGGFEVIRGWLTVVKE